jgi:type I restriction enzyme S subunit
MTDGYPVCRLGAVASVQGGFAFKSGDFTETGVPVLKIKNVRLREVDTTEPAYVDQSVAKNTSRYFCKTGDLLISMTGSGPQAPNSVVGRVARFTGPSDKYLINQRVGRFVNKAPDKLDQRYLFYVLAQDETLWKLVSVATGSANQANISGSQIESLEVPLPPLAEQKAIAVVLGALDDKIELNRRMNTTLEAMARALFQSWFVDFDPVRAKLDGRPPAALDPVTAALFPGSFDETELGHIPQGWIAGNFGKIIAAERERIGESDAVVLSAVASSQLVRSDEHFNKQVYSKSISNYLKVRRWDFAYNPSRINIGSIGMLKENFIGAVSPVYKVFRPKAAYHWFVERSLAQPDTKVWIQTLCSGSVRQSLKLRDLESIPLVIPPPPIVQAFNKTWEQWHDLIQANERESRTLAILRDTLLPKLLCGELGVASFEKEARA